MFVTVLKFSSPTIIHTTMKFMHVMNVAVVFCPCLLPYTALWLFLMTGIFMYFYLEISGCILLENTFSLLVTLISYLSNNKLKSLPDRIFNSLSKLTHL